MDSIAYPKPKINIIEITVSDGTTNGCSNFYPRVAIYRNGRFSEKSFENDGHKIFYGISMSSLHRCQRAQLKLAGLER
jgi:hypothetical protein